MAGDRVSNRRRDIQGLRAVAVIVVVAFHAHVGFSGGFIGVDVFFVISGFVITGLLTRELGGTGRLALGHFYLRRIRRLMPALGLMIVVVAIASILAAPVGVQPIAARTGAASSLFVSNFYLWSTPNGYFALDADLNPFLHTWSLAVEEQFYLVFPLLLLGGWRLGARRGRSRTAAVVVLTVVAVGSLFLAESLVRGTNLLPGLDAPREFAFFSSFTRAWEFAAGALLAFATSRLAWVTRGRAQLLAALGFVLVLYPALRYDALTAFPGFAAIPPVLGTVLLIAAGTNGASGLQGGLTVRPMVWIGDISYSWYLWHWPFIVFARALWPGSLSAPVAAALSIVPAWLSYRYVENPIRLSTRLTSGRTLAMGACVILAGVVACGGLVLGYRWVTGTPGYASVQRAQGDHLSCPGSIRAGRSALRAIDPEVALRCTWSIGTDGLVTLMGDSNASHLMEPVVAAARRYDRSVYRATSNGCPFVDVTMVVLGTRRRDCRAFYEESMRVVLRRRPQIVVIGSTTTRYLDEQQFGLVVGTDGPTATTHAAKALAWERGLRSTVDQLSRAGIAALVVHPVPKYPGWDLRGCAAGKVVFAEFTCGRSQSRAAAREAGRAASIAERAAVRDAPGARTAEFLPALCTPRTCATDLRDVWLYHDGDHLSPAGARRLTPEMTRIFGQMLNAR